LQWLQDAGPRLVGTGGAVRNLAAAAQRAAAGAAAVGNQIDIGIQGFVITAEAMSELVQTLAALPADERGKVPGIKPGRGDIILAAALALETVLEIGSFDGIEATEAGLRDGVFLARTCSRAASRCSRTCARLPCEIWRSSTSPTWPTSSTWRSLRCRCTIRWSREA